MLKVNPGQCTLMFIAIVFMFFTLQQARAFDYSQCVRDTQSHSPGVGIQHVNAACGAKAKNSGQDGAVNSATAGMASAYRAGALLNNRETFPYPLCR